MSTRPAPGAASRLWAGFRRHRKRTLATAALVLLAVLHASGIWSFSALQRLDEALYDRRLQLTMPGTLDERVVIIDIDERSLARLGQWPWSRTRVAALVRELLERQQVAALGMDVVFAEPDGSSGLQHLQQLAREDLRGNAAFADWLARTAPTLDYDGVLAAALQSGPVALGYYFSSDRDARRSGTLPRPLAQVDALPPGMLLWDGYGGNIAPLTAAARAAGFFNSVADPDGKVRIYIADKDPGLGGNWVNSFGHERGIWGLRLIRTEKTTPVKLWRVQLADLQSGKNSTLEPGAAIDTGQFVD